MQKALFVLWCEDNLESPVPQKKFSQFLLKNAGKYGLIFSKHIEGKFAFVKRSETTKSPVGTLSGRTVLRSKMEGPRPDKFAFGVRIGRVVDECRPVKGCIRK